MGNKKRIARNTIALYFRTLLALVVSLYTSRVVLNALGVSDFGLFNVVGGVVLMLSFLNGAMASAAQRFLSYELGQQNYVGLGRIFSMILNIHVIIAILVLVLAESIGLWFFSTQLNIPEGRADAAFWVYQFSIVSFIFSIICVPYRGLVVAKEKMSFFAFLGIFEAVFKLFIAYLIWSVDSYDKLIFYSVLMAVVSLVIYLICLLYTRIVFKEISYKFLWESSLFKKILSYSGWNLLGNMALIFKNQGVNILLNMFFGTSVNAARGIAFQVSNATMTFVYNIQTAINPQIVKSYAAKDLKSMHNLLVIGTKVSFFFMLLICIPIYMNLELLLAVWLVNVPPNTVVFTKLVIVNILVDTLSESLKIGAMATGNIRNYQIVTGGVLLLSLPVTYVFLKLGFGPEIGFFVSIVLSSIALFIRLYFLSAMIALNVTDFLNKVIVRCGLVVLISVVFSACVASLVPPNNLIYVSLVGMFTIFLIIGLVYTLGLNKKERFYISSLVRSKIKKI